VTERAKAKLKEFLETENDDRPVGLRLGKTAPERSAGIVPRFQGADDTTGCGGRAPKCGKHSARDHTARMRDSRP
jgi:hypothetical protein